MDCEVEWSPEATEDLNAIAAYIARDSEFYARAVVTEILAIARNLSEYPTIGRIVPEIGDDHIRERMVYNYRLVYRFESGRILVTAVIHGKRLLETLSDRFDD